MKNKGGVPVRRHILKVISFFAAITLWFYVLNSEHITIDARIPLVFITPTDLALNVKVPKTVKVKLKGSRAFVKNLNFDKEKVIVDIRDYPYKKKSFSVPLKSSMIRLPFGVKVLEIQPKKISLTLEREIRKKVPIKLVTLGNIGADFKMVKKEFFPKEMMIRGPYSQIKKTTFLNTIPIDLSTLEGEGVLPLPLAEVDERIMFEGSKNMIQFTHVIKPNKANMTLKNIKVKFLTDQLNFKSSHERVSLDVLVTEEKKEALRESDILVIAEIPDNASGNLEIKLRASLPDGVNLLQIHPEFINVSLQ